MKKLSKILLLTAVAMMPLLSSCGTKSSGSTTPEPTPTDTTPEDPGNTDPEPPSQPPPSGPTKITVNAHTLSDSNPPINVNSKGQTVDKDTWEGFRYGGQNKFDGNYNYTYTANSSSMTEKFTKNGYYVSSITGELYYERKSGNTFYFYSSTKDGWERKETTLDLWDKYTYRIKQEIYVHMFEFEEYTYNNSDGSYRYSNSAMSSFVKFQGGYLTWLKYTLSAYVFEIKLSFQTTIDIPKSFYYQ